MTAARRPARVLPARLHRRPVILAGRGPGRVLPRASIFPFFGPDLETRYLMIVWVKSGDIVLLPYRPGLIRVPHIANIRLDVARGALRDAAPADVERVSRLWHYDPWWVLAADRFRGHPAVPPLKQTNTVAHISGERWRFTRDLSRLGPRELADDLPVHPARSASGWRLAPVWTRWADAMRARPRVDSEPHWRADSAAWDSPLFTSSERR